MPLNYATSQGTTDMRNWFGVGVRLIGVWEIVSALDEAVTYVNVLTRLYTPNLTNENGFLTHAIAHLVVGFVLLFFAPAVVNAVYPREEARHIGGDEPGSSPP